MAWSNLPLGNADLQDYSFFSQIWRATKERARAFSNAIWPRGNFIWSSGVITSATDNLDGSYTFGHATDNSDSIALNRWGGYPGHPPTPANYDLIFDHDDETQVVHVHIYGSTSTTITVDFDHRPYHRRSGHRRFSVPVFDRLGIDCRIGPRSRHAGRAQVLHHPTRR